MGRSKKLFRAKKKARHAIIPPVTRPAHPPPRPVEVRHNLTGFYFMWDDTNLMPRENIDNFLAALDIHKTVDLKPRLQHLLNEIFRLCYEEREHYNALDDDDAVNMTFLRNRVLPQLASRVQIASVTQLTDETVFHLTKIYITRRRRFVRQLDVPERLALRKSTIDAAQGHEGNDNDVEMGESLTIEEDEDPDDLFVFQQTEYPAQGLTNKEARLLENVDGWIQWIDEQKGNAVPTAMLEALSGW